MSLVISVDVSVQCLQTSGQRIRHQLSWLVPICNSSAHDQERREKLEAKNTADANDKKSERLLPIHSLGTYIDRALNGRISELRTHAKQSLLREGKRTMSKLYLRQ